MITGLMHAHEGLAYLVILCTLVNVFLVVAGAGKRAGMAKAVGLVHRFGLSMGGRLVVLTGIGVSHLLKISLGQPWLVAALVLWVPVEIAGKRLVKPEIQAVEAGDTASAKLIVGAIIQLLCVVGIFGLMSARPG